MILSRKIALKVLDILFVLVLISKRTLEIVQVRSSSIFEETAEVARQTDWVMSRHREFWKGNKQQTRLTLKPCVLFRYLAGKE